MRSSKTATFENVASRIFGKQLGWKTSLLLATVAIAFLIGGGSRDDILSLLLLRPLSILILAYAVLVSAGTAWKRQKIVAVSLLTFVSLHLLQLLPLPPDVWTGLPGRERLAANLAVSGVEHGWRPLSLVPFRTWNSLFALAVPIAVWLLAVSLQDGKKLNVLVASCVALAMVSALLGLLQVASGYDSELYFYRLTNNGLAVGLFANRNHNAFFLATALPMMAYLVGEAQRAGANNRFAFGALFFTVSLMLFAVVFAGSRGGLMLFAMGLLSIPLFTELPSMRGNWFGRVGLLIGIAVLAILALVVIDNPSNAVRRFADVERSDELRLEIWPNAWREIWTYFPWGAGFGTFAEVYQLAETNELLRKEYANHAHNDWIEMLLDAGLAGAVVIIAAIVFWCVAVLRVLLDGLSERLPLLGVVVTAMLGVASFLDYPLRTPALASLFALAAVWAVGRAPNVKQGNSLR